jgi:hypothetical protein
MIPRETEKAAAVCWSGKEVLLPAPPPLRTARAPFNARSSSIGQRTGESTRCPALAWRFTWTVLRGGQHTELLEAAPASALHAADISALLPQVGLPTIRVRQHPREVCTLAGGVATPIRPITGRLSLAPSSFTRSPIGSPCDVLSLAGGLRAYHVPPTSLSGLGRVSRPVARHLRQRTAEPLHLATYLLVQASQQLQGPVQRDHTWLVEHHGLDDTSPGLTLPLLPCSRPRCCSQSQFRLTLTLPARGLRLRCPAGFAPRRCQRRTLR